MQQPGEVESDMSLHADRDGRHHVAPGGQAVAVEEPGVGGRQEADGNELPRVQVLGHPREGAAVAVVDSMDVPV